MSNALDQLARRHGVAVSYTDQSGRRRYVSAATKRAVLATLGIAAQDADAVARSLTEAPAPVSPALPSDVPRCCMPDWLARGRIWGVAVQLYQLRSERNAGIGDFEDLATLAELMAAQGADFVGTNPLHALFLAAPGRCSPFSPSNRRFLNPLYIAVDRLATFRSSDFDAETVARCRQTDLVDYEAIAAAKLVALRRCWRRWRDAVDGTLTAEQAEFDAFRAAGGPALHEHALFEALSLHFAEQGQGAGWPTWPKAYRGPRASGAAAFASDRSDEVHFQAWLQWLADRQLAQAQARALAAGMRIGLYLDLAVGEAPDGSATWSDPGFTVLGAYIGAPPDTFSMDGQNWGLAPISPQHLRARGAAPYRDMLTAVMRHAGALRIDHVMALQHLYFVPAGESAQRGTYVRYPMAEMLAALAAASHSHQTVVIGEDLGTVPARIRRIMAAAEIQSYRVFYFERDRAGLRAPNTYPRRALACLSTHDLQPLLGWWAGDDVRLRLELGQVDRPGAQAQWRQRARDRRELVTALRRAGLIDGDHDVPLTGDRLGPKATVALSSAVHGFVASTPSRLFAVRVEDLAGELAPVNLPGVVDAYPNWQRKLAIPLDELPGTALCQAIVRQVAAARPRAP